MRLKIQQQILAEEDGESRGKCGSANSNDGRTHHSHSWTFGSP